MLSSLAECIWVMGLLQSLYISTLRHRQPKGIPIGQRSDIGSLLGDASFQYHDIVMFLYTNVLDYYPRYVQINVPIRH